MRLIYFSAALKALVSACIFNKKIPLAVSFIVTNKCNYNCSYCSRWKKNIPEMTTREIFYLLRELKGLGSEFLQITGGEPFLRSDLAEIVKFAKEQGFYIGINSNGSLIKKNQEVLKYIDKITFSIDGPEEIHEIIRPKGDFKRIEEAINISKKYNLDVGITAGLTKYNSRFIEFLADFSKQKKISISFQPSDIFILSSQEINPTIAERNEVGNAFKKIRIIKKKNKFISNSFLNLFYMEMWPEQQNILCAGGTLFYRIESNGNVIICGAANDYNENPPNVLRVGIKEALDKVKIPECNSCYNAIRLSINLLYNILKLRKTVLFNLLSKKWNICH